MRRSSLTSNSKGRPGPRAVSLGVTTYPRPDRLVVGVFDLGGGLAASPPPLSLLSAPSATAAPCPFVPAASELVPLHLECRMEWRKSLGGRRIRYPCCYKELVGVGNRIATSLLDEARTEVDRVDSKASTLIATLGIGAGIFAAVVSGSGSSAGGWKGATIALAGIAAIVSLVSAVGAIWPRTTHRSNLTLPTYWAIPESFHSPSQLAEVFEEADPDAEVLRVCDQLLILSRLVKTKYRLLKISMVALIVAVLCLLCSVILGS